VKNKDVNKILNESYKSLLSEIKQGKSERLKEYLAFCSKFHKYSFANTILIFVQNSNATRVAGFRKWNELGYRIKKGSNSIKILAPFKKVFILDEEGNKIYLKNMTVIQRENKDKHLKEIRFFPVSVFDISQIINLNGKEEVTTFFEPIGDSFKDKYIELCRVIESEGTEINEIYIPGDRQGYVKDGKIYINKNIDFNNRLITLIHEWSHVELHSRDTPEKTRECQAEAVSYVIGQFFGLNNPFASDYLIHYGNDAEKLKKNLNIILKTSKKLINEIIGGAKNECNS